MSGVWCGLIRLADSKLHVYYRGVEGLLNGMCISPESSVTPFKPEKRTFMSKYIHTHFTNNFARTMSLPKQQGIQNKTWRTDWLKDPFLYKNHLVGWNLVSDQTDMWFDPSNCNRKIFTFSVLPLADRWSWNPQSNHLDTDLCVAVATGQPLVMTFWKFEI